MDKFCGKCGEKIKEDQNFCSKCGYNINTPVEQKEDKLAIVGFILGLVSIIAWFIPLFGYPVSICGIVFSTKGLKSKINKGKATAGLVLSIVFLVFTFLNSMVGLLISFDNYYYYY